MKRQGPISARATTKDNPKPTPFLACPASSDMLIRLRNVQSEEVKATACVVVCILGPSMEQSHRMEGYRRLHKQSCFKTVTANPSCLYVFPPLLPSFQMGEHLHAH